ncbi:MAG: ArsR/SmtB family transcription factor [Actinomycetota bacterium]
MRERSKRKLRVVQENRRPAECCPAIAVAPLRDEEAAVSATLFKALSDPHRVRIVNMLATTPDPVCVCDITSSFGLSQPTVSFHLKKLVQAGLLDREQRGVWAYYSLNRKAMDQLSGVFSTKGAT